MKEKRQRIVLTRCFDSITYITIQNRLVDIVYMYIIQEVKKLLVLSLVVSFDLDKAWIKYRPAYRLTGLILLHLV